MPDVQLGDMPAFYISFSIVQSVGNDLSRHQENQSWKVHGGVGYLRY